MPPVGFEPTIPAGERPQTYAFDRAATGTGLLLLYSIFFLLWLKFFSHLSNTHKELCINVLFVRKYVWVG